MNREREIQKSNVLDYIATSILVSLQLYKVEVGSSFSFVQATNNGWTDNTKDSKERERDLNRGISCMYTIILFVQLFIGGVKHTNTIYTEKVNLLAFLTTCLSV